MNASENSLIVADFVEAAGLVLPADTKIVGLWGGAAGGLSVLNCLIRYPRLVRAAAVAYPYLDLSDLIRQVDPLKKAEFLWAIGSESRDFMLARSPLLRAGRIRSALHIFHGGLDSIVPVEQVEQFYQFLHSQGVPVKLKIYEQEGHSFQLRSTRIDYGKRVTEFFLREIMGERDINVHQPQELQPF